MFRKSLEMIDVVAKSEAVHDVVMSKDVTGC
jgi:hypothetical protein